MLTAEKIKKTRLKIGLSQQQLADLMGISKITISRWERGESIPRKPYAILLELLTSQADLKPKGKKGIDILELLKAAESSLDFWYNDIDDEIWNNL